MIENMVAIEGGAVVGLLSLIAAIDIAQFAITLRHERELTKLRHKQERHARRVEQQNN